jgi:hypothetical protein
MLVSFAFPRFCSEHQRSAAAGGPACRPDRDRNPQMMQNLLVKVTLKQCEEATDIHLKLVSEDDTALHCTALHALN